MTKDEDLLTDVYQGGNEPPYDDDLTCYDCPDKDVCEYAFDSYNTNGDCLLLK